MRTSDICPTCSIFTNALCTLYNGAYLPALDINTLESVESALIKIEAFADANSSGTPSLQTVTTVGAITTNNITVPSIQFDLGAAVVVGVGQFAWNATEQTMDLGVSASSNLQLGQEMHKQVTNASGVDILDGTPVMSTGTVGNTGKILVAAADMTDPLNAKHFVGIATENITNGQNGKITVFGKISGLQTNGGQFGETWVDDDDIWVSNTTVGYLTNVEPIVGVKLFVAHVINASPSNGILDVHYSKGSAIHELHDVNITGLVDGMHLQYNATSSNWEVVSPAYLVYTALLSQSGTAAPTAIVLENTLSGPIVWNWNSIGVYVGTLAGAFVNEKTGIFAGGSGTFDHGAVINCRVVNTDTIRVSAFNAGPDPVQAIDNALDQTLIEIRVYL